jgi:hypothetical protein
MNGRPGRLSRAITAEHRSNDGQRVKPPLTPPQYTRLPWNDFTFSATYITQASTPNSVSITAGNVREQIVSRMGLTGITGRIAFKVISSAGWNVATGAGLAEPYLRGLFYEITPDAGTYAFRSDQADHGTLQRAARVGYQYPLRDRKEILTSANDTYVLSTFSSVPQTANGNITVRLKVLWLCTNDGNAIRALDDAPQGQDLDEVLF